MKAIRFFAGTDTFGTQVEVAQAVNGLWYSRQFTFNCFGGSWNKWMKYDPVFESHGTNKYTDEIFEYTKPVLVYGFSKLEEYNKIPNVRLPNN